MAYMTILARSSNFASKWRRFLNEFKTISKILKMSFGRKTIQKVSHVKSRFLNCLEIRSENSNYRSPNDRTERFTRVRWRRSRSHGSRSQSRSSAYDLVKIENRSHNLSPRNRSRKNTSIFFALLLPTSTILFHLLISDGIMSAIGILLPTLLVCFLL